MGVSVGVVIAICSAIVSACTAIFGYWKLTRDNRIVFVEEQVDLYKARMEVFENRCKELSEECVRLRKKIEVCEERCERIFREKMDLLAENRELRMALAEK